jgi:glycosyltransferase involved in cell wall biosynthesis
VVTRSVEIVVDWLRRRVETAFVKQCSQMATLTHEGAALLRSLPKFSGPTIVEMKHVAGPEMMSQPIPPHERKQEEFNVVLFGFLGPHKGIEDLLHAFEIVAHKLKDEKSEIDPRLLIFGGIPQGFASKDYYDGIRRRIEENYFFQNIEFSPGHVSDEQRDKRLAQADVMVLPFHQSHGVVFSSAGLIRAMAMGKAVVASRWGTLCEELHDGERGLLFEQGNERELADQLYRLAKDPDLRRQLGARAREHILQEHSPEALAQFLVGFYGLHG